MGRIKGPSSVFREQLVEKDESYKATEPNYLREGIKDIGAVLTISEKIYGSPLLKDAAAGLFDLFSSDKEKVVETIKKDGDAKALKDAAMSRRKGAMGDFQEAQGQEAKALDKTAPVQMPTTDAKGRQELEALKQEAADARATASGQKFDLDREPYQAVQRSEGRLRGAKQDETDINLDQQIADYNEDNRQIGVLKDRITLEETRKQEAIDTAIQSRADGDPRALEDEKLVSQINSSLLELRNELAYRQKEFAATKAHLQELKAKIDIPIQEASAIVKDRKALLSQHQEKLHEKARKLTAMASKKAAELNEGREQEVAKAIDRIVDGGTLSDEEQAKFDAMKSKLQVDEETGDIMLNVTTEERVAISNDPEMSVYLAAATKQLEQELQQPIGGARTGDALADALAGASIEETPGPTGAGEEVATVTEEVTTTPTATRLIGDEAPVDLPGAITAENFRKIQDDVASDYITYKPEINDAIDKLKAIYGPGAFGSTPQEVQATIRTISQSFGSGVPAQGIEVPDIAGMSIQEAEGVVMEIAASNASMSAKTKAMRKVLKQAGDLDDVVPAWMARGGSLGYLDRDMAADRLRKAFTGMIPKPKATRAPSLSEQIKLSRLPDIQEGDKLKNVKARQDVIREELALPHDIKKKLLDATKGYQNLKIPKTGGGGRSGAGRKKLDELEKRLERNANSDRKFFQSSQERIKTQVTGLQNLTVAKIMDDKSNQQIAKEYGPDLARYLQDVRSAKTDAEKQAALKKAKANIRNDLRARAKTLKANQVKLAELVRRLNVELLQKNLEKKEATLREINELWADIQKGL